MSAGPVTQSFYDVKSSTPALSEQDCDMDAVFHRLLQTPRESREFARLWNRLDAYLDVCINRKQG